MKIEKTNSRITYIDIARAFACFLMVWGHVTINYEKESYHTPVAIWIYSFHMALFMMLSGMFLSSSLKKTFKVMTLSKTKQLIVPVLTWSVVYLFLNELFITPVNQWNSEIISFIKGVGFLHGLWFLKCLFFYYIICWLSLRYLKKEWLAVSVTMIVVLLLPDVNFSSKMLPFFWAGYFFMKYRSFIEKHQYRIGSIALLIMCILWFFWIPKYTYVESGKDFIAYSMRTLMGITSSICWILLFKYLSKLPSVNQSSIFKWLLKAGTCTLGIYCCHAIFYEPIRGSWWFDIIEGNGKTLFLLFSSCGVYILSYYLVVLFKHFKWASLLLMGEKKK